MGKSCSLGLQYVFCTMARENNSLNKGDVHNCRLYDKIEIETRVCVQMVRMIRCSCSFPLFLWRQVNWCLIICITKFKSSAAVFILSYTFYVTHTD